MCISYFIVGNTVNKLSNGNENFARSPEACTLIIENILNIFFIYVSIFMIKQVLIDLNSYTIYNKIYDISIKLIGKYIFFQSIKSINRNIC